MIILAAAFRSFDLAESDTFELVLTLIATLQRAITQAAPLALLFTFQVLIYAAVGQHLYGPHMIAFAQYWSAVITVLSFLPLPVKEYAVMSRVHPGITPLFVWSWTFAGRFLWTVIFFSVVRDALRSPDMDGRCVPYSPPLPPTLSLSLCVLIIPTGPIPRAPLTASHRPLLASPSSSPLLPFFLSLLIIL